MRPKQLILKLQRWAKHEGIPFELILNRGKGSHAMVILGHRKTTVPMSASELKTGTLKAILKQLQVKESDL